MMIVAFASLVLLAIAGITYFIRNRYGTTDVSNIPTSTHKTGLYKGSVVIQVRKKNYNTLTEPKKVEFTAIVKEKSRFGDKIEVKYIKLINTPDIYHTKIMAALNDQHELIPLKDVQWQYNIPDVLIKRDDLRTLLNNKKVTIGEIEVKIDEDIERSEILDIVIQETHE